MKLKGKEVEKENVVTYCSCIDAITTSTSTSITKENFHDFHRTPHHLRLSIGAFDPTPIFEYNKDNGYCTDVDKSVDPAVIADSKIDINGDNSLAGFLHANAIIFADAEDGTKTFTSTPTSIVNTNNGFVFAGVADDGEIINLGHVDYPCIVGTGEKAEGIYIPFSSRSQLQNGIEVATLIANAMVPCNCNCKEKKVEDDVTEF